jgi:hypothetical protein
MVSYQEEVVYKEGEGRAGGGDDLVIVIVYDILPVCCMHGVLELRPPFSVPFHQY